MSTDLLNGPLQTLAAPVTLRVQQCVCHLGQTMFESRLNELLLDGWRVVPGTFAAYSCKARARAGTPLQYVDQEGNEYRQYFFVVVERTEVRNSVLRDDA